MLRFEHHTKIKYAAQKPLILSKDLFKWLKSLRKEKVEMQCSSAVMWFCGNDRAASSAARIVIDAHYNWYFSHIEKTPPLDR